MTPEQVSILVGFVFIAYIASKFINRKKSNPTSGSPSTKRDPLDERERDLRR